MRMQKNLFLLCAFLVPALISAQISSKDAWKQASKLEKSIEKTSFPKRTYNITDFGAKPDMPEAPCHDAINLAIVTCCLLYTSGKRESKSA